AELGVHGELEIQLFAAAVAGDLPVEDFQFAEHRSAGHGHPLPWWVDQVADLLHCQALGKVAAALERDDQYIAAANRAAIAGYLIAARRQRTAFGEGVGGV